MAAGDINVTVVGNLTNDPELRFTPSGAAVASFTVASSSRVLDKATNEWKDGDTVPDQGHSSGRDRSAEAAQLRDP
jgi:single-strand DNA-binding protein